MDESTDVEIFSAVPHYRAVTNNGKQSISKFTHALAEFIDNSIEATRQGRANGALERKVEINIVHHRKSNSPSFLTIADNGCGMTVDDIKKFAVYALDKKSRNETTIDRDELDSKCLTSSYIGRFGVGAKQSGFWLGDRIRVITRKLPGMAERMVDGKISEIILDENVMSSRSSCSGPHADGEGVYDYSIRSYPRGNCKHSAPEDESENEKLMELIDTHEMNHDSFTFIIIRLKKDMVDDNFEKRNRIFSYMHFPHELAQIYHFHLHPEHSPSNIHQLTKFNYNDNKKKGHDKAMYPSAKGTGSHHKDTAVYYPLSITFSVHQTTGNQQPWKTQMDKISLAGVDDAVKQHIDRAGACFRFTMKIPKPRADRINTQGLKNLETDGKVSIFDKEEIQCILFYFPYIDGVESRPMPTTEGNWDRYHPVEKSLELSGSPSRTRFRTQVSQVSQAASKSARSKEKSKSFDEVDDDDDDDDDDDEDENERKSKEGYSDLISQDQDQHLDTISSQLPTASGDVNFSQEIDPSDVNRLLLLPAQSMFDIHWSGRLVPDSHLVSIPKKIFVGATTGGECQKLRIAENWRSRLKGYVFFTNQWGSIANNKLKLIFDNSSDLSTYLDQDENKINCEISCAKDDFKNFLQQCHNHLDREYTCFERMRDLEATIGGGKLDGLALFSRVVWGNENGFELNVGDEVKINVTPTGKVPSKLKKRDMVLGKIVCFSVDGNRVKRNDDMFTAAPNVHFLRLPLELYHGEIETFNAADFPKAFETNQSVSIKSIFHSGIDFSSARRNNKKKMPHLATEKDIRDVKDLGVHRIEIFTFNKLGGVPVKQDGEVIHLSAPDEIYKIGVQLLNKSGVRIMSRPPPHIRGMNSDKNYAVRTFYTDDHNSRLEANVLWRFDDSGVDVPVPPTDRGKSLDAYYVHYGEKKGGNEWKNIVFHEGDTEFMIQVLDPNVKNSNFEIMRKKVVFRLAEQPKPQIPVTNFRLVLLELDHDANGMCCKRMRDFLPRMQIELLDDNGSIVKNPNCKISISFKCKTQGSAEVPCQCFFFNGSHGCEGHGRLEEGGDNYEDRIPPLQYVSQDCEFIMGADEQGVVRLGYLDRKKAGENSQEELIDPGYAICYKNEDGVEYEWRNCELGGLWRPAFPTNGSWIHKNNLHTFLTQGIRTKLTAYVNIHYAEVDGESQGTYSQEGTPLEPQSVEIMYHSNCKIAKIELIQIGKEKKNKTEGALQTISVSSGDHLPNLVFQCYDRFGIPVSGANDTTPRCYLEPDWIFEVTGDFIKGVKGDEDLQGKVDSKGEVTFSHLKVKDCEHDSGGLETFDLKVRFLADDGESIVEPFSAAPMTFEFNQPNAFCRWEPMEDLAENVANQKDLEPADDHLRAEFLKTKYEEYKEYVKGCEVPSTTITCIIVPDSRPAFLYLYQKGILVEQPWEVEERTVISDLSVRVHDKNSVPIVYNPKWFPNRSFAKVSWSKVPVSKPEAGAEFIKIPNILAGDVRLDNNSASPLFHISLQTTNEVELTFGVCFKRGVASSWNLKISENLNDEGLQAGSPSDFASKLLYVVMEDENGKEVPWEETDPLPMVEIYDCDPFREFNLEQNAAANDDDDDDDVDETPETPVGGGPEKARELRLTSKELTDDVHDSKRPRRESAPIPVIGHLNISRGPSKRTREAAPQPDPKMRKHRSTLRDVQSPPVEPVYSLVCHLQTNDSTPDSMDVESTVGPPQNEHGFFNARRVGLFYFPPNTSLQYPENADGEDKFIWIVVKDSAGRMEKAIRRIEITRGLPHHMEVRCPALAVHSWSQGYVKACASRHVSNPVIEVMLMDEKNFPAAHPRKLKKFKAQLKAFVANGKKTGDPLKLSSDSDVFSTSQNFSIQGMLTVLKMAAAEPADDAMEGIAVKPSADITIAGSYKYRNEEFEFENIVLNCELTALNNVVHLDFAVKDRQHSALLCMVPCDEPVGEITISMQTDDRKPLPLDELSNEYSPLEYDLEFSDRIHTNSKRRKREWTDYFSVPVIDEENGCFVVEAIKDASCSQASAASQNANQNECLWKVGFYHLHATYTERRTFGGEMTFPPVSVYFTIGIAPGQIASLYPDEKSFSKMSGQSATSVAGNRDEPDNVIAKGVNIFGRDERGNSTHLPEGSTVSCHLERAAPMTQSSVVNPTPSNFTQTQHSDSLPKLYGADDQGFLSSTVEPGKTCAVFDLQLQEGCNSGGGMINMIFTLVDAPQGRTVETYSLPFEFCTDGTRTKKIKKLLQTLGTLNEKVKSYEERKRDLEDEEEQSRRNISILLGKAKTKQVKMFDYGEEVELPDVADLKKEKNKMKSEINRLRDEHEENSRPVVKDGPLKKEMAVACSAGGRGEGILGHIVELGFCNGPVREAELLSWVAYSKLHLLVVDTEKRAQKLRKEGVSVWALDQCSWYQCGDERRRRRGNDPENRALSDLELKPLFIEGDYTQIEGHPRAMVNLITLAAEHEYLRDTIFFTIFGKSVLFDDMDSLFKYKNDFSKRFPTLKLPTLYALKEGARIESSGIMDARAGGGQMPKTAKSVFGTAPAGKNPHLTNLEHDVHICEKVIDELEKKNCSDIHLKEHLQYGDECKSWKIDVKKIKAQLEELGNQFPSQDNN